VFGGEVEVQPGQGAVVRFQPLPQHPAVSRDLALLVADGRPIAAVLDLLATRGARLALESVAVVDEFRGKGIPEGRRSVAIRLTFRAPDRTLTDAEVDKAIGRLVPMLERELDVTLRTT
jgi:phenylalanyl-tRNA synthetase beta chain